MLALHGCHMRQTFLDSRQHPPDTRGCHRHGSAASTGDRPKCSERTLKNLTKGKSPEVANDSKTGPIILHGPHHVAVKSTATSNAPAERSACWKEAPSGNAATPPPMPRVRPTRVTRENRPDVLPSPEKYR
eukprot:scaffold276863_cov37-Tisochrysis_lutea.AAC.1